MCKHIIKQNYCWEEYTIDINIFLKKYAWMTIKKRK